MDYRTFLTNIHKLIGEQAFRVDLMALHESITTFIASVYASGDVVRMTDDLKIVSVKVDRLDANIRLEWVREWLEPARYHAPKGAIPLLKTGHFDVYLVNAPAGNFVLKLDGTTATYCVLDLCPVIDDPVFRYAHATCMMLGLNTVI